MVVLCWNATSSRLRRASNWSEYWRYELTKSNPAAILASCVAVVNDSSPWVECIGIITDCGSHSRSYGQWSTPAFTRGGTTFKSGLTEIVLKD